ncbi:MAG: class I SAM-dependent methyltransferase [Candidatus Dojkabacteria bacterium]|nr:class I SAM-dependent methyltransferase [Candidatus Dojkabacteria bacterium]
MDRTSRTIARYDSIATDYAQKVKKGTPIHRLEMFAKKLIPGSKVLDAGCAAGRDSRVLKDFGFHVTGVDLSRSLLEIAKQENPDIKFVYCDIRNMMEFDKNSFDGIWACGVFHELDRVDMRKVLLEFNRILRKGGLLFIRTKQGKETKTKIVSQDVYSDIQREVTFLSKDELHKMLVDNNFLKDELLSEKSSSREGLWWINAYYRK